MIRATVALGSLRFNFEDTVLRKASMLLVLMPASTPRRYIAFEMVCAITRPSGTASGGIPDGAVVDDSCAQGSIGESGLPYYKVGAPRSLRSAG